MTTEWFWNGINASEPNPPPVWFSIEEGHGEVWKPLRRKDCVAINNSERDEVLIEGGRAVVDLKNLIMSFNFYRKPCRRVKAAIWFERLGSGSNNKPYKLLPLSKLDEAKVEQLYQRSYEATQLVNTNSDDQPSSSRERLVEIMKEKVILEDEMYEVVLTMSGTTLCLKKRPRNKLQAAISLEMPTKLLRGYGPYYVEGESEEIMLGPVSHLYFVIHGIGEAMWSREDSSIPSMVEEMENVRIAMHKKQFSEWRKTCRRLKKGQRVPPPPNRIEFIPIEWYDKIHSSSSDLKKTLVNSTLETIPVLRGLANDVVFDVLTYQTPEYCQLVLTHVTKQITELYANFLKLHPHFQENGSVSIIGHSLGSVIAWDLLCVLQDNLRRCPQTETNNNNNFKSMNGIDPNDLSWSLVQEVMSRFKLPIVGSSPAPLALQSPNHEEKEDYEFAAWGPRLHKKMTDILPFIPTTTILLGSPLAMFLSLRGAYPALKRLNTMLNSHLALLSPNDDGDDNETNEDGDVRIIPTFSFHLPSLSIYNIFHPSDPVAYRIEPLLLPEKLEDDVFLPPPSYLILDQGKVVRPRANACKATYNAGQLIKRIFATPKTDESQQDSSIPFSLTENIDKYILSKDNKNQRFKFPLGGKNGRIDFMLQPSVVSSEYLASTSVHQSYFSNEEFLSFIMHFEQLNTRSGYEK